MWYLEKSVTISSAHHLLNYEGKCKEQHGHNWKITVYCKGEQLDFAGMLIDFQVIKDIIMKYDHKDLNNLMEVNPTAEYFARILCEKIEYCYKVKVEETDGSSVTYER